ncbi:MAG TPA: GAF domain-containing protein [Anaerolineales bacterium]|nr:GAF domain-containing protein [Anaerolineales bacterium]
MSIRSRIILALLLIGLLAMSFMAFQANQSLVAMRNQAVSDGQAALEEAGRQAIRDKALSVAAQLYLYLTLHPEIDLSDPAALESNPDLRALAVQPVGQTGYTAVHDDQGINHFHSSPTVVGVDLATMASSRPGFWEIVQRSLDGTAVEGYYGWLEPDNTMREKFMVIVPIQGTNLRVAATTYIDEFSQPGIATTRSLDQIASQARTRLLISGLTGAVFALLAAVILGVSLTNPLKRITDAAARVSEGDWSAIRPLKEKSELGILSRALHAMTVQMRTLFESLEEQVASRTKELSERTVQLEAAAQVAREAAGIRDVQTLLDESVRLVSDRFGYYHAGIYLTDDVGEYAILRATNSEGGRRLVANQHKVRLGDPGVVSYVASAGKPRVVFDVGADDIFVPNPELPETRSEMGLPLKLGERVIGVLDVQSNEVSSFAPEDISTLQILADQVALAVENAHLLTESQRALSELDRLYAQQTLQTWQKRLRDKGIAFRYTRMGIEPADATDLNSKLALQPGADDKDGHVLKVPIVVRGQDMGTLILRRDADQAVWSAEEAALVKGTIEQIGPALESARLLEEAQRRAAREQAVNVISTQVRGSVNLDAVLQNTVRELGKALGASRTFIRFGLQTQQPDLADAAPPDDRDHHPQSSREGV